MFLFFLLLPAAAPQVWLLGSGCSWPSYPELVAATAHVTVNDVLLSLLSTWVLSVHCEL